jgi:hypothetical protein
MATKKMCDMNKNIAAKVFVLLNNNRISIDNIDNMRMFLITDTEPKDLLYPEGWYYAKGRFTNKHNTSTGLYEEIYMMKSSGESWQQSATYCTLYC